ncbi:hypothetical protein M3Y95_00126400 [Aphelenchoides besseyi]|nr:hypothetical protein M3Y95_00126400 [Aphelenchoides besseyi]
MDNFILGRIDLIMRSMELLSGILCVFFNLYFIIKLSQLSIFNRNLKYVLNAISLSVSIMSVSHFTLGQIDYESYALEKGKYIQAVIVHLLQFICQVCALCNDVKWLLVALERTIAYKQRYNYENRGNTIGKRIVIGFFSITIASMTIKALLYYCFQTELNIDERLDAGFSIQASPMFYIYFGHSITCIGWLLAVWQFRQLEIAIQQATYGNLSVRFEETQTATVLKALRPLLFAYGYGLFAAILAVPLFFYVQIKGYNSRSLVYQVLCNVAFLIISIYNFCFVAYLMIKFKPIRRLILKDFCTLFSLKFSEHTGVTVEPIATQELHFQALNAAWNQKANARENRIIEFSAIA